MPSKNEPLIGILQHEDVTDKSFKDRINLPPDQHTKLRALQRVTGRDFRQIIGSAIRFYEWMVQLHLEGVPVARQVNGEWVKIELFR